VSFCNILRRYLTHIPDILVNYFHNGLVIDLVSSLPLDLFYRLYLISGSPSPPAIIGQLLKLMRYAVHCSRAGSLR
jgi:hypothetical protein